MPFEIIWSPRIQKELKKLGKELARRIVGKINEANTKDQLNLEKVEGTDYFKYRIGQYRTIFRKVAHNTLLAIRTGHRKNVYKNLHQLD